MPGRSHDDNSDEALIQLRKRLSQAVTRICPAWLAIHAEDIVQAAMMRIVDSVRSDEGIADLRSLYVRKAAYSAMVDEIRRIRRDSAAPDGEEIVARAEDRSARNPEQRAHLTQLGQAIRGCLAGLVDGRRVAVTLYLQGHSVPETSRLGRFTLKQAENLVYRGLADLRRCLTLKGHSPDE